MEIISLLINDNMRPIPEKMKQEILSDPEYQFCMRSQVFHDHVCQGRITLEHALIHAGRQINEKWAIIPLCAWAHDVDQFQDGGNIDKRKNEYCAVMRATDEDLAKYPKKDWQQFKKTLVDKYGELTKIEDFKLF